jgi:hypothetical protein
MWHRTSLLTAALLAQIILASPSVATAYDVMLRWSGTDDPAIAGYHVIARAVGGAELPPVDVARPRRDGTGQFTATIGDFDVATSYVFTLSAYDAHGFELSRSNERSISYAEAAAVVDSDHDGRTDAEEDVNLNLQRDAGETNRLVADTDGDLVPDGIEIGYGADPLTPGSPSCAPLDFNDMRVVGRGTASVGFNPDLDDFALVTQPTGRRSTGIGVMYPREGKGSLTSPLIVTRLLDNDPFRIEIQARSTAGKLYRMRYDGHGSVTRITKRRLRRDLGAHFAGDQYQSIGIDVAAELAVMDPTAVLATIERISVRGSLVMQRLHLCH